ncbi:hypothetical protein ABIG06_002032 [Bradyrhizobium sp. USDA 326]
MRGSRLRKLASAGFYTPRPAKPSGDGKPAHDGLI